MKTKTHLQILLSGVALSALPLSAATTLWDDSFAGTTLDNSWQVHDTGSSTVTQDSGLEILQGGAGFDRSFLATNNVQAGTDATTKAQFNGNAAYNFFNHDLQLTYDALTIPSDVTAGHAIFTLGFQGMRLLVVLVQGTGNPALFCGFGKVPALSSWACWIILVVVVEPHTVLKL